MELKHVLGLLAIAAFFIYVFSRNCARRSYLLFVLYCFPLIDLNVTNQEMGSFTVFDVVTYFSLFFFFQELGLIKKWSAYFFLAVLFSVFLFLGSIHSEFIHTSVLSLIKFLSIFVYAKLIIDECTSDPTFIKQLVNGLKFTCVVSVAFLIVQLAVGIRFTFYDDLNPNIFDSNVERLPSFFQDPQMYAQFLAMTSFLFLYNPLQPKKIKPLNYLLFITVVFVQFFTGGRSGFLGLCIGMALLFAFSGNRFRLFALACIGISCLVMLKFPDQFSLFNRQEGLSEAYDVRFKIWGEALGVFKHNPWFGIGIGNYRSHIANYSLDGYYLIDNEIVYYGAESGYLLMLAESGIPGLMLFCSIVIIPIASAIKSYRRRLTDKSIFLLIAGVISWMTAFATLNTLSDKRTLVSLATLLCLLILSKRKGECANA